MCVVQGLYCRELSLLTSDFQGQKHEKGSPMKTRALILKWGLFYRFYPSTRVFMASYLFYFCKQTPEDQQCLGQDRHISSSSLEMYSWTVQIFFLNTLIPASIVKSFKENKTIQFKYLVKSQLR
jgi:hypothetical protein